MASKKAKGLVVKRGSVIAVVPTDMGGGVKVAVPQVQPCIVALANAQNLPPLTIIATGRLMRRASELMQEFQEARMKLIQRYGTEEKVEGKPTGNWSLEAKDPEKFLSFLKAEAELLNEEVEVGPAAIKLSAMGTEFKGITGEDIARCMALGFITDDA